MEGHAACSRRRGYGEEKGEEGKGGSGKQAEAGGRGAKRGPAPAAASEMAKLRDEVTHWQHLHSQLQEQVRAKDSTIGKQMAELMELRRSVEELRARAQPKHP
jgi:hypothetical protein